MKDFLSEQSIGNRFLLFCLFIRQKTAKRDRIFAYFTKNSQNTGSEKMSMILLYGRKTKNVTEIRVNFL